MNYQRSRYLTLKNILPLFAGTVFFITGISIHHHYRRPDIKVSKQDSAYNLNRTFLQMISLGNKRVISNILWIQTLLESDLETYKKHEFADWMYLRFLTIATLDPRFYENYLYGGIYLSVVKDDLTGAAEIFELGLKEYPLDYSLNYYAGFNYFFEMGDMGKGYELLKKITHHPRTPQTLKFVIDKLRFEVTRDYDIAITLLNENMKIARDESIRKKLAADLYSVLAERDLNCLNEGKENCARNDMNGAAYIKSKEGKWIAQAPFRPYKIFRPDFLESKKTRK